MWDNSWTGVRFPSAPPNERYANTILEANVKFSVFENAIGIMVNAADYDTGQHIQTKKATCQDIQTGVREQYGTHVTNSIIV